MAYFIAPCRAGAKRNPIPIFCMHSPTRSGLIPNDTPAASSTSALPQLLDMDLLPCLATGSPAPATTKAVVVDTLNVPDPSPPVPQVSTRTSPCPTLIPESMGVAFSRMTRTAPVISSTVSPFIRNPVIKEPIWAGVASPPMISFMTSTISSTPRSCFITTFAIACFIFI